MANSKADVLEAVKLLDSQLQPTGLAKKPSVKDLESILESAVTAAERDEAWSTFKGEEVMLDDEGNGDVTVANNHTATLSVFGVDIRPGEAKPVPNFDAEHAVMKVWIEKEVISVK